MLPHQVYCFLLIFVTYGCQGAKHLSNPSHKPKGVGITPTGNPSGDPGTNGMPGGSSPGGSSPGGSGSPLTRSIAVELPPDEAARLGSMCPNPKGEHVIGLDKDGKVICAPNEPGSNTNISIESEKITPPLLPQASASLCLTVDPGNTKPGLPYGPGLYGKDYGFNLSWKVIGGSAAEKFVMRVGYFLRQNGASFVQLDKVEVGSTVTSIHYPSGASNKIADALVDYRSLLYGDVEFFVYLRGVNNAGPGPETDRISVHCVPPQKTENSVQ